VTAEFAMAMPAVILLLAMCLATMQLSTQQLRVQDAATVAARTAARGDGAGAAAGYVGSLVPGATVSIERRGDLFCARVAFRPAPANVALVGVLIRASSCAPSGES
jgi:hypothetical protein